MRDLERRLQIVNIRLLRSLLPCVFSSLFAASPILAAPKILFPKLQLAAQWKTLPEVIELNCNIVTIVFLEN